MLSLNQGKFNRVWIINTLASANLSALALTLTRHIDVDASHRRWVELWSVSVLSKLLMMTSSSMPFQLLFQHYKNESLVSRSFSRVSRWLRHRHCHCHLYCGATRSDGRKSPTRPWGSVYSMEPGLRSNPIHSLCLTLRLRNLPWEPLMLATSLANNGSENRRATGKQVRVHGHRSWWHWREMFTTGRTTILG